MQAEFPFQALGREASAAARLIISSTTGGAPGLGIKADFRLGRSLDFLMREIPQRTSRTSRKATARRSSYDELPYQVNKKKPAGRSAESSTTRNRRHRPRPGQSDKSECAGDRIESAAKYRK